MSTQANSARPGRTHLSRGSRIRGGLGHAVWAPLAALFVLVLVAGLPASSEAASPGAPSEVGAYCPLPAPGERPSCQLPARERYGEFFDAVETGTVSDAQAAVVESVLDTSTDSESAYLALSSLAYGYWRLADLSARPNGLGPAAQSRLERWNGLLERVYGRPSTDPEFRAAVRAAAYDLHARTPQLGMTCGAGRDASCRPTATLVGALAAFDQNATVRTPMARLLERILGQPSIPVPKPERSSDRP